MANIHPSCKPVSLSEARFNTLTVKVDKEGSKFNAKLHIVVQRPYTKEISLTGPMRDTKPEAIKDGMELGRRYVVEGEAGARTVLLRLKKKKWSAKEVQNADENELTSFVLPGLQGGNQELGTVEERLVPPGEGWVRHSEDMLVHPPSQVFFFQTGSRAGSYVRRHCNADGSSTSNATSTWEDISAPHSPQDHPVTLRTGSASCMRYGNKLDRAVILNDITRIARLALKLSLSFVDRPAFACAVFQGLRSAESAQWCAENFHKKLLTRLARKIHAYDVEELQKLLQDTLEDLDNEILKSSHAFSGCSAVVVLILGNKLVVAGVGQARAIVLPETGPPWCLLACSGSLNAQEERKRVEDAGGSVQEGILCTGRETSDDTQRILSAPNSFDVLMIPEGGPSDEKQIRTAYRKLALRVHPDKQAAGADVDACKRAFARLDCAKDDVEAVLVADADACRGMCQILRTDVHTRSGAAGLLGLDGAAVVDTIAISEEAEKACKQLVKKLAKVEGISPDCSLAISMCKEAVETMQRGCTSEALPRQEALLKEGVCTGRALGLRDLRLPRPMVLMESETAAWQVTAGSRCRLCVLCGAVADFKQERLVALAEHYRRQPKASALSWCLDPAMTGPSGSAVCVSLVPHEKDLQPTKRARLSEAGPEGTVRVRHILIRHQQVKLVDPMARREGTARNMQEAEEAALQALETLMRQPNQFIKLCRELSDCQTGMQPGTLAGDLGWVGRGQLELSLEEAIFALAVNEFSDVVTGSRGVHIIQRLA